MAATTITFRTDEQLKKDATKLYESLGMNLSVAINMFLKQSVLKQKYPCALDLDIADSIKAVYPPYFLSLFGSCPDFGFECEPDDPVPVPLSEEL